MSDEKAVKKEAAGILQEVEGVLDAIAEEHKDHDCGTSDIALGLSAGIKIKREKLAAGSGGPAQVATDKYRKNFDAIFMSKGGTA
jgi:hypothetical protein